MVFGIDNFVRDPICSYVVEGLQNGSQAFASIDLGESPDVFKHEDLGKLGPDVVDDVPDDESPPVDIVKSLSQPGDREGLTGEPGTVDVDRWHTPDVPVEKVCVQQIRMAMVVNKIGPSPLVDVASKQMPKGNSY